jgi:hypothetical protein
MTGQYPIHSRERAIKKFPMAGLARQSVQGRHEGSGHYGHAAENWDELPLPGIERLQVATGQTALPDEPPSLRSRIIRTFPASKLGFLKSADNAK